jgi:hypothetical protein
MDDRPFSPGVIAARLPEFIKILWRQTLQAGPMTLQ